MFILLLGLLPFATPRELNSIPHLMIEVGFLFSSV